MELELVSLPCQTVNSLGAATRAINPLLVLQFSTQPRTAINNRPLSKVDQQPSSISPGFPELSEIPFYIVIFFPPLPLPLPLAATPIFVVPRRCGKAILTTTRSQKGDFLDRGEKEIRVLWSVTLEFKDSCSNVSNVSLRGVEENKEKLPVFDFPFRSFAIRDLWFMLD